MTSASPFPACIFRAEQTAFSTSTVCMAQLATEGISAAMQQSSSWSLGVDETERLFEQIARVKSEGVGGGHEEKKAG